MRRIAFGLFVVGVLMVASVGAANAECTATGFGGLTAALVNPTAIVTGEVNATGCDMGVYFDSGQGAIKNADIHGALYYGVFVNGDTANVSVDVINSHIYQVGDTPFNGNQRGVGIYYRAYFSTGTATGRIAGNTVELYQKGGIVVNGPGSNVLVQDNRVLGLGAVNYIAQNGIQFGYGSSGSAMRNMVTGHSYTGTSAVSGGIVVVGGDFYGTCPDGNACAYTTNIQIVQNTLADNDIGVFLTNLAADGGAPADMTNVKAVNNVITNAALTNGYGGFGYQAGVSDVGNNDKIINNKISGDGYDPAVYSSAYVVAVDADPSFTNRPKVHANK